MDLDDSNPDLAANEVLLGDNLNKTDRFQPTPCNSCELSPVTEAPCHHGDSVVELEASQDELDELDRDESMELSVETSQESHVLKHQLHEKLKQVKKVEKQTRIQHLHSQLTETDHQLDMLRQKTLAQSTLGKSSSQSVATSTPQTTSHQDQSWLQQADIDAADAFLNQLNEIPVKGSDNHNPPTDKSSKPFKKQKPAQPWFILLEQKCQCLDVSEVSSTSHQTNP